ncbi:MAG: stage II sporulation protein D [Syntrophomonadaceae bacterium]|nr:stage II sporulation protein D [Syntrophomonadaceae bacterium]
MRKKTYLFIALIGIIIILVFYLKACIKPDLPRDPLVKLFLSKEDKVITLPLEEYLVGCVAAEMPANFDLEALKAQAVCARTYAIRKLIDNHPYPKGANLSDDITTCQAYISESEFIKRHGRNSEMLFKKIKKAVKETEGIIIIYDDEPIDALYHSTCGGRTADAEEVWGNQVAYLKSKPCNYCKESKRYSSVQVFSFQDLNKKTGIKITPDSRVKEIKGSSGRTLEIDIDNIKIKAAKLRSVLDLPSSWIRFNISKNKVMINIQGYGHGVGLCQYGANGLAKEGASYEDILKYYYEGVDIYKINY